jgi:hypothetical protein
VRGGRGVRTVIHKSVDETENVAHVDDGHHLERNGREEAEWVLDVGPASTVDTLAQVHELLEAAFRVKFGLEEILSKLAFSFLLLNFPFKFIGFELLFHGYEGLVDGLFLSSEFRCILD